MESNTNFWVELWCCHFLSYLSFQLCRLKDLFKWALHLSHSLDNITPNTLMPQKLVLFWGMNELPSWKTRGWEWWINGVAKTCFLADSTLWFSAKWLSFILFCCVYSEQSLLIRGCNQLGQFLTHKETNLRYDEFVSFCENMHAWAIKHHKIPNQIIS